MLFQKTPSSYLEGKREDRMIMRLLNREPDCQALGVGQDVMWGEDCKHSSSFGFFSTQRGKSEKVKDAKELSK